MTMYDIYKLCSGVTFSEMELSTAFVCQDCASELLNCQKFRLKLIETANRFKEAELICEEKLPVKFEPPEEEMDIEWIEESYDVPDAAESTSNVEEELIVEKSFEITTASVSTSNVEPHIVITKSVAGFECPNESCASIFTTVGRLKYHLENKHHESQGEITCDECSVVFANLSDLKQHRNVQHTPRPFVCDICDRRSTSLSALRAHIRVVHLKLKTETKAIACPICGKVFPSRDKMTKHRRIHFKEKLRDFICPTCNVSFTSNDVLRRHLISHTEERPFKCLECEKTFKTKGNLTEHFKAVHIGQRSFICNVCSYGFKRKRQLDLHMMRHSDAKPFTCTYCNATFVLKDSLKVHQAKMHVRPLAPKPSYTIVYKREG